MPKLTGAFSLFQNLDTIPVEDVARWIKHPPDLIILYNFIANRICYPQTISTSAEEVEWELGLLREALRKSSMFLDIETKKIIIPEVLFERVPSLSQLVLAFVDAYVLGWPIKNPGEDVWSVAIRNNEKDEVIGSVLTPEFSDKTGNIVLSVNKKSVQSAKGGVLIVPCSTNNCVINYQVTGGKLLGLVQGAVSIPGGKLGILIDARN